MPYLISFLEGLITFISPCLLPMLPITLSYFAGNTPDGGSRTLKNALGFSAGFTLVFMTMGVFAGTIGRFLQRWQTWIHLVTGAVVVLFGLSFLGLFELRFPTLGKTAPKKTLGFLSSALFGMVFSVSWTPCVGAFLGSALMLASHQGSAVQGLWMLFCYSLGLAIPFVLSAMLISYLKSAFDFIKRHYRAVNAVSGVFLILVGILMMTGWMGRFLSVLS